MTEPKSAAIPQALVRYTRASYEIDQDWQKSAASLTNALTTFKAECTEFPTSVSDQWGNRLDEFARYDIRFSDWVQRVGMLFWLADQGKISRDLAETALKLKPDPDDGFLEGLKKSAAGSYLDSQIAKALQITVSDPSLATSYTVGPPTRPDITHDNGFLDQFDRRDPGAADYWALAQWRAKLEAGEAFRPDLADGLAAYRHFLDGEGEDRTFNYDRFVEGDDAGQQVLDNAIGDGQRAAALIYQRMLELDPSLKGKPVSFDMTSGAIQVGANPNEYKYADRYPYPTTENWQKAIGAHPIWTSAKVTVNPGEPPDYSMKFTLHAEDRYNFNPGAADIATGAPDADNGRFEITGLAHQYTNYSTLDRDVTWKGDGAQPHDSAVDGAPDDRQRRPSDNRRARNRI